NDIVPLSTEFAREASFLPDHTQFLFRSLLCSDSRADTTLLKGRSEREPLMDSFQQPFPINRARLEHQMRAFLTDPRSKGAFPRYLLAKMSAQSQYQMK